MRTKLFPLKLKVIFLIICMPFFVSGEVSCTDFLEAQIHKFDFVNNYMTKLHKTILNDYKTPDGVYSESCGGIAWKIAEMFLDKGENPEIIIFHKDINDGLFIKTERLLPLIYNGRVSWGAHLVTLNQGLVYDPIFGVPVAISDYSEKLFGKNIPWEVSQTSESIRNVREQQELDK